MAVLASAVTGCASFHPVETTPEGILTAVRPGDTVRLTTREGEELKLLVWTLNDYEISGRRDGGDSEQVGRARYDRIETIEVRRLDLKKAMLTTVVPVIIGAVVFCNNNECETRSGVTAEF